MSAEIERRFLLDAIPEAHLGPGTALRQGYLARTGDVEVRLRIGDDVASLTVKAGRGLARAEVEVDLPLSEAEQLWLHTAAGRLEKTRHRVPVGDGLVADVDVYGGELSGLRTAEVEFDSEEGAAAFTAPDWFGREVTGEARWSNAELAAQGLPA